MLGWSSSEAIMLINTCMTLANAISAAADTGPRDLVDEMNDMKEAIQYEVDSWSSFPWDPVSSETVSGARPPLLTPPKAAVTTSCNIAIVGMACRYPEAKSLDEFWELLAARETRRQKVLEDRFSTEGFRKSSDGKPKFWGTFNDDVNSFNPRFFGKSSREAATMDPQQRLLLEVTYEALKSSDYFGTPRAFPSGGISHFFNWTGPSMTYDTACSSSAVTIHAAYQALQSGACSEFPNYNSYPTVGYSSAIRPFFDTGSSDDWVSISTIQSMSPILGPEGLEREDPRPFGPDFWNAMPSSITLLEDLNDLGRAPFDSLEIFNQDDPLLDAVAVTDHQQRWKGPWVNHGSHVEDNTDLELKPVIVSTITNLGISEHLSQVLGVSIWRRTNINHDKDIVDTVLPMTYGNTEADGACVDSTQSFTGSICGPCGVAIAYFAVWLLSWWITKLLFIHIVNSVSFELASLLGHRYYEEFLACQISCQATLFYTLLALVSTIESMISPSTSNFAWIPLSSVSAVSISILFLELCFQYGNISPWLSRREIYVMTRHKFFSNSIKQWVAMFEDRKPTMVKKSKSKSQKIIEILDQIAVSMDCVLGFILHPVESLMGAIAKHESSGGSASISLNDDDMNLDFGFAQAKSMVRDCFVMFIGGKSMWKSHDDVPESVDDQIQEHRQVISTLASIIFSTLFSRSIFSSGSQFKTRLTKITRGAGHQKLLKAMSATI